MGINKRIFGNYTRFFIFLITITITITKKFFRRNYNYNYNYVINYVIPFGNWANYPSLLVTTIVCLVLLLIKITRVQQLLVLRFQMTLYGHEHFLSILRLEQIRIVVVNGLEYVELFAF